MKEQYRVEGFSYPYENAVHIVISNGTKTIAKTYERKGAFYNFMLKYGLFDVAIEIALKVWKE